MIRSEFLSHLFRAFLVLAFGWLVFSPTAQAQAGGGEKQRIEALISHVENLKDAKFIRNGTVYTSANAAKFLRAKWDSKSKEIKTAEDFIAKVATVSSTTGKPYIIKFADGREVKCGSYLKEQLAKP